MDVMGGKSQVDSLFSSAHALIVLFSFLAQTNICVTALDQAFDNRAKFIKHFGGAMQTDSVLSDENETAYAGTAQCGPGRFPLLTPQLCPVLAVSSASAFARPVRPALCSSIAASGIPC